MSRREEATAQRRQAILDAALQAFASGGLGSVTIGAVSSSAGASVGSIYHHFGDRTGLLAALYTRCFEGCFDPLRAVLRDDPTAEEGIRRLVAAYLQWVAANRLEASFIYAASDPAVLTHQVETVQAYKAVFFAEVATWMMPRVMAGQLRMLPPWAIDPVLMGPAHEWSRRWLHGLDVPMDDAIPVVAESVWRSIAP